MALLEVRDLTVRFRDSQDRPVVREVDLSVERGSVLGLVGETGAGKTLTTRAILRAIHGADIEAERIEFDGIDLLDAPRKLMQDIRGKRIGVVVQDARSALNPMQSAGASLRRIVRTHHPIGRKEARERILEMFASVGLPDPEAVYKQYPHELSGGMAQRVVIAAALVTNPDLIIADEATTGLDLTVQSQILELLQAEIARRNAAAIVVTHDLGIIAHYCDEVAVMYDGKVRERGPVRTLFAAPAHPYTAALLAATSVGQSTERLPDMAEPDPTAACEYAPRCPFVEDVCRTGPLPTQRDGAHTSLCRLPIADAERVESVLFEQRSDGARDVGEPILEAHDVHKRFRRAGRTIHAVNGVSVDIRRGETVAIVGESGSGKSTLGRCILRLIDVDSGEVLLDGDDITAVSRRRFRPRRTDVQAVFQDPGSSLDGRMRALDIVIEPLEIFRRDEMTAEERRDAGRRLMSSVGLNPALANRYPRQLSGGQQQRVAIARAIATHPRLVVLDEPTASLDVSVRGQVLDTLGRLQREHRIAYLLISHDLRTVRRIADRVVVMYLGEIVEAGSAKDIFERPGHPYTRALLSATLLPDPSQSLAHVPLRGEIPTPTNLPTGCYFAGRCPLVTDACRGEHPPHLQVPGAEEGHTARCIRLEEAVKMAYADQG